MKKTMTVAAAVENVGKITEFIDAELEAHDCSLKSQMQIDVAIDELFSNIAYYAYAPGTGDATVDIEFDGSCAILTFTDSGVPYDPLQKEDPDVTLAAADRGIGGLGIFIVKKTMDEVSYKYEDGKNILRIKKSL